MTHTSSDVERARDRFEAWCRLNERPAPDGDNRLEVAADTAEEHASDIRTILAQPRTNDAWLREAVVKVRDGYASQMKFCDIEPLGYFREFVQRIDAALTSVPISLNEGD